MAYIYTKTYEDFDDEDIMRCQKQGIPENHIRDLKMSEVSGEPVELIRLISDVCLDISNVYEIPIPTVMNALVECVQLLCEHMQTGDYVSEEIDFDDDIE